MSARGPLPELETIQLLEETVGPKSLRNLRNAFTDETDRRLVESLARHHAEDLRELEDVLSAWRRAAGGAAPEPRREAPAPERDEILRSLVELKESEASILRRAAADAPADSLRERLLALAARAEGAAEKLKSLTGG